MLMKIKNFIHSNMNCNKITIDDNYIDTHLDIAVYAIGALLKAGLINKIKKDYFVEEVIKWQKERGLNKKVFYINNELSFIFEELLELCLNKKSEELREDAILMAEQFLAQNKVEQEDFIDIYDYSNLELNFFNSKYNVDCLKKEVLKELNNRTGSFIDGKWVKNKDAKTYKANFKKCIKE